MDTEETSCGEAAPRAEDVVLSKSSRKHQMSPGLRSWWFFDCSRISCHILAYVTIIL